MQLAVSHAEDKSMIEDYSPTLAKHYSAFRPPLHEEILRRLLSEGETFENGLDVGCGTGYSSIALAKYCSRVYGVDPSESMRKEAIRHEKVFYLGGSGEALPLPAGSIDIATFAGSLFYTRSLALVDELKRVCRDRSAVIVYDFEILVDTVLSQLGVTVRDAGPDYDHGLNLSGYDSFIEQTTAKAQIDLYLNSVELAHVLLSSGGRYDALTKRFNIVDPFDALSQALAAIEDERYLLKVDIYYSKYSLL